MRCGKFNWLFMLSLSLALASGAFGQKKSKSNPPDASSTQTTPLLPNSVSDELDHDIGEMLGAFQVGDVEAMHKYYADNATFVSGVYAPPVVGWANYVPIYQRQRAPFQGMQLLRRNTFVFNHGDAAWASYQWELESQVNGKPYTAYGQTTLVFNKVGNNWLIVHNHTSQICMPDTPTAPQSSQPAPSPLTSPKLP